MQDPKLIYLNKVELIFTFELSKLKFFFFYTFYLRLLLQFYFLDLFNF